MMRNKVATDFTKLKVLLIREGLILSENVAEKYNELRGLVTGLDETQLEIVRSHEIVSFDLCRAHWQSLKLILDQHEFKLLKLLAIKEEEEEAGTEASETYDFDSNYVDVSDIVVDLEGMIPSQYTRHNGRRCANLKDVGKVDRISTDGMLKKNVTTATNNQVEQKIVKLIGISCASEVTGVELTTIDEVKNFGCDAATDSSHDNKSTGTDVDMEVADLNLDEVINNFVKFYFTSLKTLILLHYKVLGELIMIQTQTLRTFVQPVNNTMSLITSSDNHTRGHYVLDHDIAIHSLYSQNTNMLMSLIDEHIALLNTHAESPCISRLEFLVRYHITLLVSVVAHRKRLDRLISESGQLFIVLVEQHFRTLRDVDTGYENREQVIGAAEDDRSDWEIEDDDDEALDE